MPSTGAVRVVTPVGHVHSDRVLGGGSSAAGRSAGPVLSSSKRSPLYDHYERELRSVFAGRKLILIGGPVAGLVPLARELVALGAERPFILGSDIGTGELPDEGEAEWCSLEVRAGSVLESIRHYEATLLKLPDDVRARIDAYDPDRSAMALGFIVLGELPMVAGRPHFGARPRSWIALEDKLAIDDFWDAVGVERARYLHVHPVEAELRAAANELDAGSGTVWAADAREGVSGGAEGTRWVRDDEDAREAARFFSTRAGQVRVMPFLEGIPCSIHGLVTPDGAAVFRPVEQMILRRTAPPRLHYAGVATFWDPDARAREQMRQVARRTARGLAERVRYSGAFSVDGVLTADGFVPTELNPRLGAGLGVLERSLEGLPLRLLALCAQAGRKLDFRPDELEQLVVTQTDARRSGGSWTMVSPPQDSARELELVDNGDGYRRKRDGEAASAKLSLGPSAVGGFLRFTPDPERTLVGPTLAPRVCRAFALADEELGTALGAFEPAAPSRDSA